MNTTNILLGTTSLLLVVAFALSFGGYLTGQTSETSKEELAELREDLARLDAEERAFQLSQLRATAPIYTPATPAPIAPIPVAPSPVDEDAQLKEELRAQLEDRIKDLETENNGLRNENEEIQEDRTEVSQEQRMAAFRVKNALKMGDVTSSSKENALVIFTPTASANFQPGKVLAVRRNSGIIGLIQVDRLDDSGDYVATMRPHGYSPDGYPDIQPGDAVIIDPKG